jgi:hypothetical protein
MKLIVAIHFFECQFIHPRLDSFFLTYDNDYIQSLPSLVIHTSKWLFQYFNSFSIFLLFPNIYLSIYLFERLRICIDLFTCGCRLINIYYCLLLYRFFFCKNKKFVRFFHFFKNNYVLSSSGISCQFIFVINAVVLFTC